MPLDQGGEARPGVLAVGCDEVLAEGDPLTSVAGLDVGRLRFVTEAVGEFVGVRIGFTASSMARWSPEEASLILMSHTLARERPERRPAPWLQGIAACATGANRVAAIANVARQRFIGDLLPITQQQAAAGCWDRCGRPHIPGAAT